jgi:hypothetical protein
MGLRAYEALTRGCDVVTRNDAVLSRAMAVFLVAPTRTLNAIHSATLNTLDEPPDSVRVLSRDP